MPNIDLRQFQPLLKQAPLLLTIVFAAVALFGGMGLVSSQGGNNDSSSSQTSDQAPAQPLPANKQPGTYVLWNTPERDANGNIVKDGEFNRLFARYSPATNMSPELVTYGETEYPGSFVAGVGNDVLFTDFTQNHNRAKITAFFAEDAPHRLDKAVIGIIENGKLTQPKEIAFDAEPTELTFITKGTKTVRVGILAYVGDKLVNPDGVVLGSPRFAYIEEAPTE